MASEFRRVLSDSDSHLYSGPTSPRFPRHAVDRTYSVIPSRSQKKACFHQKVWYRIQSPGLSWLFMEWSQIVVSRGLLATSGLWNEWDESGGASLLLLTGGVWGVNFGHTLKWDNSHLMVRNRTKKAHGHQVCSNRVRSQMQMHWKDPTGLWTRLCHTDKLISVGHGE